MITPQNEQHHTELSVLGYILANGSRPYLAGDVITLCSPKAFLYNDTRHVAEAVAALAVRGANADIMGVVAELRTMGALASVGGAGFVGALAMEYGGNIWTEDGLLDAARALASEHRKREAQTEIAAIMRNAQTPGVPADQIAEEMRASALKLESGGTDSGRTFRQQVDGYVADLDSPARTAKPVPTPWKGVNRILRGGIMPGELAVLAARPSAGKSVFALNFAWSVASSGKKSVMFSLEMPEQQLFDRLAAGLSGVEVGNFRKGLSPGERDRVRSSMAGIRHFPFSLSDKSRVTVGDIRRRVRLEQRGDKEVGLVVVDYLQLLLSQEKTNSREREVAEMSRALKLMAVELRVPVLVLAQLNRKSEEARRVPMLSDLRESGAIEQDADIVIFLHQARQAFRPDNPAPAEDEPVKVIVAKGRSSGIGQDFLVFRRNYQQFWDSDEVSYARAERQEYEDASEKIQQQTELQW